MKRKTAPKVIDRKIQLFVGGKQVKTVRTRITMMQATREIGEQRLFTKGDTTTMSRRIGRFARITVTWTAAQSTIDRVISTHRVDPNTAKMVARGHMLG